MIFLISVHKFVYPPPSKHTTPLVIVARCFIIYLFLHLGYICAVITAQ